MNYFLQGFGVFLGVIAGVVITILTQLINDKIRESQKVKNLKFELKLNIKKIDKWSEELNKYRNAVNGDTFDSYFGYFNLSRFVTVTANEMFQTGLLYKYLDHDAIEKLQIISTEFSVAWEELLNKEIAQNRDKAIQEPTSWTTMKKQITSKVNFWDNKFKEHKKALEDILNKLA
jgi:hypothetical protein